jgi:hypothetical protein
VSRISFMCSFPLRSGPLLTRHFAGGKRLSRRLAHLPGARYILTSQEEGADG